MRELDFIQSTLEALAPFVREQHALRDSLKVHQKDGANELLTQVDLEVQDRIVRVIQEQFPGDTIVAEEAGLDVLPERPESRCWFIDPIDGTQNFVRGLFPEFGVSIAFAQSRETCAGGIAMPVTGDVFLVERGHGATRNGRPIHVSKVDSLGLARVDIDFSYPRLREGTLRRCTDLLLRAGQVRCYSAAIVGLCSVACGEADAYTSIETHPWDAAAGALLIEEAGGKATSFEGDRFSPLIPITSIAVSNGIIHDELLRMIAPG